MWGVCILLRCFFVCRLLGCWVCPGRIVSQQTNQIYRAELLLLTSIALLSLLWPVSLSYTSLVLEMWADRVSQCRNQQLKAGEVRLVWQPLGLIIIVDHLSYTLWTLTTKTCTLSDLFCLRLLERDSCKQQEHLLVSGSSSLLSGSRSIHTRFRL